MSKIYLCTSAGFGIHTNCGIGQLSIAMGDVDLTKLYLVPCNAMSNGGMCAEDRGLIMTHTRLAEQETSQPLPIRLRILLSYHYYKDCDLDALFAKYFIPPYPDVFLDSGGFSAATQGVTIDMDAYIAYIKKYKHLFTTYANLDVIGDAKKTLRNHQIMESAGLTPIPVFHVGEDFSYLASYIESHPYIALGGMVPYMRDSKGKLMPWLIKCFKMARGKSVFHGFGCTSWKVMKALPWYSVDSSSWGAGFRYGDVPIFDAKHGCFREIRLGNHQQCYQYADIVRSFGFNPGDFADRKRNDRSKICALSALSYIRAELWLRKRHGEVRIPTREDSQVGPNLHLATGAILGDVSHPTSDYPRALGYAHKETLTHPETTGLNLYLAEASPGMKDIIRVKTVMEQENS